MILAIDPGKMSGYAWCNSTDDKYVDVLRLHNGEYEHMVMIQFIDELAAEGKIEQLIVESFTITGATLKKTRQPWSLEQIGAIRYIAHKYSIPFVLQTPAAAKAFATDDKLRAVEWYRSDSDHARDAARHLMLYLVAEGRIDLEVFRGEG